ncbi:hypothetical protein C9374_003028 [Naegleria lovaniensis]|uniref:C2 domain-containing protein n=1 Tax=Naegleria lovaniensis TaxID=51637 RepID=A0AA88GUA0_NAELO|nr:uncharacterized protein C9374_003028 [Naegleria lovaniensis]KAG2385879.1 hypothetical protein C9374_003028 [Naegleria lovaniensis]
MDDTFKLVVLGASNIGSAKTNPYLKVKLGESFFKQTKPVRRTCHPKFNEIFDIPFDRKETHCIVEVWDYDMLGQDKVMAHVKIPILDEGDGVTRNAQFEELKDKEIMSFLTYKYSIHRSTKPDDYGAVMSTFDDYPYFGTFRIYETWEISLKDSFSTFIHLLISTMRN